MWTESFYQHALMKSRISVPKLPNAPPGIGSQIRPPRAAATPIASPAEESFAKFEIYTDFSRKPWSESPKV